MDPHKTKACSLMGGLRILLVGPFPDGEGKVVGGVQAVTSALAHALSLHEVVEKVTVLSFLRREGTSHCVDMSDRLQVWYLTRQKRLALPSRAFLDVLRARLVVAETNPDVIHGQGIGIDGYIATCMSNDAVVTVHGLVNREEGAACRQNIGDRVRGGLMDKIVRRVLGQAKVVIFPSMYASRELNHLVRGHRVSIPNPILPEFFAEADSRLQGLKILFAGMMIRPKNLTGLLRAFAFAHDRVPQARLVVVGPSPDPVYAQEVHDTVDALHLRDAVEFLGHIENADLLREIRSCRALALFSQYEASPTIIAQAMASSKPVVASRVGGIPEMVIDGETGFLVEPSDERAFGDKLTTLLKSPERCRLLGKTGRELAQRQFWPAEVASQTLAAYQLVTKSDHEY